MKKAHPRSSRLARVVSIFAVVAATPLLSGCLFLELNGGYYGVSYDPPDGVPEPEDGIKPGFGVGASIGAYMDFDHTVRVSPGAGIVAHAAKPEAGGEGSAVASGLAGMVDVTPYELGDSARLGGTLGVLLGTGKVSFTPPGGGEELSESGSGLGLFLGATLALFSDDSDAFLVSLGPYYQRSSTDEAGALTAIGPQLRLVIAGDVIGGDDGDSGGGSSGGGSAGGGSGSGELAQAYCGRSELHTVASACAEVSRARPGNSCEDVGKAYVMASSQHQNDAMATADGLMCAVYCTLSRNGASDGELVSKGSEVCVELMNEIERQANQ